MILFLQAISATLLKFEAGENGEINGWLKKEATGRSNGNNFEYTLALTNDKQQAADFSTDPASRSGGGVTLQTTDAALAFDEKLNRFIFRSRVENDDSQVFRMNVLNNSVWMHIQYKNRCFGYLKGKSYPYSVILTSCDNEETVLKVHNDYHR
ncbi:hypothetical protein ENBRE01_3151, partial [Enteropsectra breve]